MFVLRLLNLALSIETQFCPSVLCNIFTEFVGLSGDDFVTEELESACADIQDTLEADNYEDELPQREV